MQPVSMLMSNLNVEANTHHAPNALAAAQDTGQSQEIVREGIRIVQTVQASEAASEAQRVHRKNENNDQQQGQKRQDSFEHTSTKSEHEHEHQANNVPLILDNVKSKNIKKSFDFLA